MNNLIIIGNGFDLAHGLKTRYNHFIEHLVNSHCKDKECYKDLFKLPNYISDYSHLKNEILSYTHRHPYTNFSGKSYNWLDTDVESAVRNKELEKCPFKSILISSLIWHSSLNNWCDIEEHYFQLLNTQEKHKVYFQNPKLLNDDFEILKKYLEEYLIEQEKEAKPIKNYSEFFSNIDSSSTLILNFNYTHTIENLYQRETSNSKIIHIHGELENENNPIIFGYAASHEEARDLLGKNDKEYLRNIKKQLYKRTDNEHQLSKYLNIHENIYLSILGHSCGFSDKLILKQILNHKNINKDMNQGDRSIRIFYYKEYESYFETQVNIDRIMNDDERFRTLLVDFTNSDSTPQFDDNLHLAKFFNFLQNTVNKEKSHSDMVALL